VHFRLLSADHACLDEGDADIELAGGALVVMPAAGPVIRVAPADLVALEEHEPYLVRAKLVDGATLELSRLGAMRTQLLAELRDARTTALKGIGTAEVFPGSALGGAADLCLYDDALVIVPVAGPPMKIAYPFLAAVETDASGYAITLRVAGGDPVLIERLASRTTEFLDLLRARSGAAAGRTAHFLAALLPGLGPIKLRALAARLRDGVAAPRTDIDAIDPSVFPALLEAATLPERLDDARRLAERGPAWLGFKQVASVERPAVGVQPWRDSAITPTLNHDGHASSFAGAVFGFGGPYASYGPMLAYGVLGVPYGRRAHLPRADVNRGYLTPATTDYDALTQPRTVLAFLLVPVDGTVVYQPLNDPDAARREFAGTDPEAVNRQLDLANFGHA
jgi:hypothetical protein